MEYLLDAVLGPPAVAYDEAHIEEGRRLASVRAKEIRRGIAALYTGGKVDRDSLSATYDAAKELLEDLWVELSKAPAQAIASVLSAA